MKLQEVTLQKKLSTPQIQLVFQTAAEVAAESGANKTALGKVISRKESIEQAYEVYLQEGPFGNIASKAAGLMKTGVDKAKAGAQAVAAKTAPVRKELGNKITQKKLMTAWNNLGRPKDVGSIYDILYDAGLDKDLIQAISVQSNVKLQKDPKPENIDLKKLAAEIKAAGINDVIKTQLVKPKVRATGNPKQPFKPAPQK